VHSNFLTVKNTFVVSTESWGGKRTSAGTSSSCCQFIQPSSNSPVKEIKTVIKHDQIYDSLVSAVNEWLPRSWATNADCPISWATNTEHYFHHKVDKWFLVLMITQLPQTQTNASVDRFQFCAIPKVDRYAC